MTNWGSPTRGMFLCMTIEAEKFQDGAKRSYEWRQKVLSRYVKGI